MDTCHYGLNIMKDTVCVGLSMKSIDYWECGLPIVNNLKGDTREIVEKEMCGVNINNSEWKRKILNADYLIMRKSARCVYLKYFSDEQFKNAFSRLDILSFEQGIGEK